MQIVPNLDLLSNLILMAAATVGLHVKYLISRDRNT